METTKTEKIPARPGGGFDTVTMMRDIRNKISSETQNMTFNELKAYIKAKIRESKLKPVGK